MAFNGYGVWAIYRFEMARALRTLWQSVVTPVITTALYFVVFGSAIGGRMEEVGGVPYGAFIVPGLVMLSVFTQSIFNGSFGIYFPKFTGTIYEILSAPVAMTEILIGYVGAAASKGLPRPDSRTSDPCGQRLRPVNMGATRLCRSTTEWNSTAPRCSPTRPSRNRALALWMPVSSSLRSFAITPASGPSKKMSSFAKSPVLACTSNARIIARTPQPASGL